MQKKFIDKKKARVFKVVHRSLEESQDARNAHVLTEVRRGELVTQKLIDVIDVDEINLDAESVVEEEKFGEAAKCGIFYDDTEYDYTQHLRKVGLVKDAIVINAPESANALDNASSLADDDAEKVLRYDNAEKGDLDPSVREVLEALEDDRYMNDFSEDFVNLLNCEEEEDEEEEDDEEEDEDDDDEEHAEHEGWESKEDDVVEIETENEFVDVDRISCTDDDEFDKVLHEYEDLSDADDGCNILDPLQVISDQQSQIPLSGINQVDYFRKTLVSSADKQKIIEKYALEMEAELANTDKSLPKRTVIKDAPKWDCNSVLALMEKKSSSEFQPKVIRTPKIVIEKSGFAKTKNAEDETFNQNESEGDQSGEEGEQTKCNLGEARPKDETSEEKKARKAAIKLHKQIRRSEKKNMKLAFNAETEKQNKILMSKKQQCLQMKL